MRQAVKNRFQRFKVSKVRSASGMPQAIIGTLEKLETLKL